LAVLPPVREHDRGDPVTRLQFRSDARGERIDHARKPNGDPQLHGMDGGFADRPVDIDQICGLQLGEQGRLLV
jgi:hypothetical protein